MKTVRDVIQGKDRKELARVLDASSSGYVSDVVNGRRPIGQTRRLAAVVAEYDLCGDAVRASLEEWHPDLFAAARERREADGADGQDAAKAA